MQDQKSFVYLEHEFEKKFRDYMNQAEDWIDIENFFKDIVIQFINSILEDSKITMEDIIIDYENKKIKFSKNLRNYTEFMEIVENSDLIDIIDRFAKDLFNRVRHKRGMDKKVANNINISSKKM